VTVSISAVIPTFDRPELLVKAVASVHAQTSPADEIIVVDNGTTPVREGLLPSDVRLLRIAPRAGVSAARNAGAAAAASEYVAFLDDDDRWDSDYLAEVRATISGAPHTPDLVIGRKDREVDGVVDRYKEITSLDGLRDRLLVSNPGAGGQNVSLRRAFLERFAGFRAELRGGNDRAFAIDAIDAGAVVALAPRAVAVKVLHHGEQITDGRHSLQNTWRFLRIYWRTMTPQQRRKNLERLVRTLRHSASMRRSGPSRPRQ
jgi:glycosyltransferase involved in cell wall biosynthesis